jgi:hypothetical protein
MRRLLFPLALFSAACLALARLMRRYCPPRIEITRGQR